MSLDRREFLAEGTMFLLLTGAASRAWAFIEQGRPQDAPDYDVARHWWAMFIDIEKCIGCGRCVDACKVENDVPPEAYFSRTWVERYIIPPLDPADPRRRFSRSSTRPTAGVTASRARARGRGRASPSSCRSCATTAQIRRAPRFARWAPPSRAPTAWCWSTRPTASAAATASRPARTAAASSIRAPTRSTSARSVTTGSPRG